MSMNINLNDTNIHYTPKQTDTQMPGTRDLAAIFTDEAEEERVQGYGEKMSELRQSREVTDTVTEEIREIESQAEKADRAERKEAARSIAQVREDAGLMNEALKGVQKQDTEADKLREAREEKAEKEERAAEKKAEDRKADEKQAEKAQAEKAPVQERREADNLRPKEDEDDSPLKRMADRYNQMLDENENSRNSKVQSFIKTTKELVESSKEEFAKRGVTLDENGRMQYNPVEEEDQTTLNEIEEAEEQMKVDYQDEDGRVVHRRGENEEEPEEEDAISKLNERMTTASEDVARFVPDQYMSYDQNSEAQILLQSGSFFEDQT